jgi:hypothetical protein
MRRILVVALAAAAGTLSAQGMRVNPTGVSVNAHGATTVFLTFGGSRNVTPAEAFWCGELIPAAPAIGSRCDPRTIFGQLPERYALLQPSGTGAFTDIMSIPPSVARRAYLAAVGGATSTFFYVRRFRNLAGGPDEFVAVTCRLTGGGARTPFSLTDVAVTFDPDVTVLAVSPGTQVAPLSARIAYNGSGRLKGRWEVVLPGEEPPAEGDLFTEGTLPAEQRGAQRRFTQIERFNVFLPPGGPFVLSGPDPARFPTTQDGTYLVLLRIEADAEREGDSDLRPIGAGTEIVHSGAVAGFPMPVARYVVGAGSVEPIAEGSGLTLLAPRVAGGDSTLTLRWVNAGPSRPRSHRVTITALDGSAIWTAFVAGDRASYQVPPFVRARLSGSAYRWRVDALDGGGRTIARTGPRTERP